MIPEKLLETWSALGDVPASPSGLQRIRLDTEATADLFACVFWPSRRPGLLVEGAGERRLGGDRIPTCRGVRMIYEVTAEPRTVLRIMLEDDRLLEIFAVLSADLINTVSSEPTVETALRRCIDRLCMWQGLFDRLPAEGLSAERQRGMLGELLVLESMLLPYLDPLRAVEAWSGPDPKHQDFIRAGLAIEVKTSLAKRHARIVIANEKQLDERPHETLLLAYLSLDDSETKGISLPTAVERMRALVCHDHAAAREFDDRLLLGGYLDVHAPLYQQNRWQAADPRFFRVDGDFPRLTGANLPPGVGDIQYSIIADDLKGFELKREDVVRLVGMTRD